MKNCALAWVAIVAVGWPWAPAVHGATKAEQSRAAADVVEETLRREATQGVDDRGELLRPTILQAPHCEAAYWQSGFIYNSKRKEWLRWDEIQQLAAKDDQLATYRQTRETYAETMTGQTGLAGWCSKHRLEDQARAHLSRVLELDPDHAEARKRLGFRLVDGLWVDDRDIAEARTITRKATAAAAKWVPRLEKLRDRLSGDNAGQTEKARAELMAIRDPEAVEAIDTVFCRPTNGMSLLGIELLKDIPTPRATAVLAWHAAFSPWFPPWPPVGQAAATAPRSREKYDYVPLLLDAAQSPNEPPTYLADSRKNPSHSTSSTGPASDGSREVRTVYRLDYSVSTYSWNTVERLKEHPYWWQVPQMRFNPTTPDPVAKTTTNSMNQGGAGYTIQQREYYVVRNGRLQDRPPKQSRSMHTNAGSGGVVHVSEQRARRPRKTAG